MLFFWAIIGLPVALVLSLLLTDGIIMPTLSSYDRLATMIERFRFTDELLWLVIAFILWSFYVQWLRGKVNVILTYWSISFYLLLLFIVLFTKAPRYRDYNLEPLSFAVRNRAILTEAAMNLLFFIPLGMLYGLFAKWYEMIIIALGTILGIEVLQYLFYLGTFDVSDIVLNFVGCVIGYGTYFLFAKRFRPRNATQQTLVDADLEVEEPVKTRIKRSHK